MTNFKPRKTIYKGIEMRSRLEAGFAQWLDGRGVEWEYEPCAFGSPDGQYLPDFRLRDIPVRSYPEPATLYVEVKPRQPDPGGVTELVYGQPELPGLAAIARRMGVIWESEPAAALALIWPGLEVDNATPGAMVLMRISDPDNPQASDLGTVWLPTAWSKTGPHNLGLADPLMRHAGPWPDGYWNVR